MLLLFAGIGLQMFRRDAKNPLSTEELGADTTGQENDKPPMSNSCTDTPLVGSPRESYLPDAQSPAPPEPNDTTGEPLSARQSSLEDEPLAETSASSAAMTRNGSDTSRRTHPASEPVVHMRTTQNLSSKKLSFPFEASERVWSISESTRAVELYRTGKPIFQIARTMRIDQKQVAMHLVRELFGFQGELNDLENAPRNGKSYTDDELAIIVSYFEAGSPIQDIATAVERTVLGVGWRMLDRRMV
ncbi:hypothetical protein ACNPM8_14495 [Glutamicibacter sp. AGC46]